MNESVANMREEFDWSFADAQATGETLTIDFLAIRAGGLPLAIELSEVAALVGSKRIIRLPSSRAGLLGVASLRGELMPVYRLGAISGRSPPDQRTRWIAVARHKDAIAFAFEEFDGHLRVPAEHVAETQPDAAGRIIPGHLAGGETRAVIRLAPLIREIEHIERSGIRGET